MVNKRVRDLGIGLAVASGCAVLALAYDLGDAAAWTAAVTGLCAVYWVLEPIPVPVTSLIPFAVFPLTGVLDHKTVAHSYGHTLILLLMGGFMLSLAVEKSGVHRRLALGMVRITGGGGRRLVLGFMLASAVCSMWISNTATVLMLLPVALAAIESSSSGDPAESDAGSNAALAVPLLLGIAYAASIGGMGTPVGTPPNVIFMASYERETGQEMSFLAWMKIGIPAVLILVPLAWLHVTRNLRGSRSVTIDVVGAWRPSEVRVLAVFGLTAAAWIFRAEPYGGWSGLLDVTTAGDSTVALAAVVLMFLIPSGESSAGRGSAEQSAEPLADGSSDQSSHRSAPVGTALLDWATARQIPWGLLLLFGGGIAISAGFKASGLSDALGAAISQVSSWHIALVTLTICLSVTFFTEVVSNTATANLLMPILGAAATAASLHPALLMVPATLSASCAFMLPVATAPNAIVAGTRYIHTRTMVREGFLLNVLGALVLTGACLLLL